MDGRFVGRLDRWSIGWLVGRHGNAGKEVAGKSNFPLNNDNNNNTNNNTSNINNTDNINNTNNTNINNNINNIDNINNNINNNNAILFIKRSITCFLDVLTPLSLQDIWHKAYAADNLAPRHPPCRESLHT